MAAEPAKQEKEQSMEEILQSIRRIIAEEGDDASATPPAAAARISPVEEAPGAPMMLTEAVTNAEAVPSAKPAAPSAAAGRGSSILELAEVLELTDMVREDGTVVNVLAEDNDRTFSLPPDIPPAMEAEAVMEAVPAAALEVEEPAAPPRADVLNSIDQALAPPAAPEGPLLSDQVAQAAAAAFRNAAAVSVASSGAPPVSGALRAGMSVEELAMMALQPLLKSWMDQYLTAIVERIVEREVRRIADTGGA